MTGAANITSFFDFIVLNKFLIESLLISISACVNKKNFVLTFEIKKLVDFDKPIFFFE